MHSADVRKVNCAQKVAFIVTIHLEILILMPILFSFLQDDPNDAKFEQGKQQLADLLRQMKSAWTKLAVEALEKPYGEGETLFRQCSEIMVQVISLENITNPPTPPPPNFS